MSSFVIIELDTTPPQIEVYAPRYTTDAITNEITIESNEPLASYQEIYIIDSNGDKYDYTFEQKDEDTFVGIIRFNNIAMGIATIYVRMKDGVDNFSNVVSKAIEIKKELFILQLEVNDSSRGLKVVDIGSKNQIKDSDRGMNINDTKMNSETINFCAKIEIKDSNRLEEDEVL